MNSDVSSMSEAQSSYYQCMHCNFKLPKENFNLVEHSCFANLDDSTEAIYVVETDRVYKECRDTRRMTRRDKGCPEIGAMINRGIKSMVVEWVAQINFDVYFTK
ncbi:transcription termination factor tfs [Lasius niger]|uniref:Transcription termination factor tfs n=1 Tax=Lasius niger TaxID=67767 RepID=A0A0J7K593_LASNI|nr:transcription termination factor tfs [Lasius niger]